MGFSMRQCCSERLIGEPVVSVRFNVGTKTESNGDVGLSSSRVGECQDQDHPSMVSVSEEGSISDAKYHHIESPSGIASDG